MTEPLVPIPDQFTAPTFVGGHSREQLWRVKQGPTPFALRLLRLENGDPSPILDPSSLMPSTGEMVRALGLETFAKFHVSGRSASGCFVAEEWVGDRDLRDARGASPAQVIGSILPIARDLAKLHGNTKAFHGGIRPSRIRLSGERAHLVAYHWSMATVAWVRALYDLVERPDPTGFVAPERIKIGPAAVGNAMDVYSLARTLLWAIAPGAPPADLAAILAAAASEEQQNRPTMAELVRALSSNR